jgi:hypothetical protein
MEAADDAPCTELSMLQSMLVRREVFIVTLRNLDPLDRSASLVELGGVDAALRQLFQNGAAASDRQTYSNSVLTSREHVPILFSCQLQSNVTGERSGWQR